LERVLRVFLEDPQAPHHGYDLMTATRLASGTLYPMLARLQDEGVLTSAWAPPQEDGRPPRKVYEMTGDGVRIARQGLAEADVAELGLRGARVEHAGDADTRAAVAEERSRIARELHDVVAHHVSVMTVQAAGAQRALGRDPDRAREAMAAIEATGRTALTEMRRIVGVLRTGGPEEDHRAPAPGLGDLPALVSQVREAGLALELVIDGDVRELPQGVDLTAYRIVQEALTNSLRHARDTRATVRVHYGRTELRVQVLDDGDARGGAGDGDARTKPAGSEMSPRRGHGLIGMRERVGLYRGTLSAGPRRGGGFEVLARLPLPGAGP
jgi:signal transduction histidine kinase